MTGERDRRVEAVGKRATQGEQNSWCGPQAHDAPERTAANHPAQKSMELVMFGIKTNYPS